MQETIEKLEKEITGMFYAEPSGHDIHHLKRVLNLALHIQQREGGDRFIVGVSAFLHDVHRIIQKETGKYCEPKDSLPIIEKILRKAEIPSEKIPKILHCIEFHEEYSFSKNGKSTKDIETLIVQDADNLDAIGAVGIGRAFAYGGANKMPMWVPEIPLGKEFYEESNADASEIHHFYSKLLKLKNNMNTNTAKKIAQKRHEFMERFLAEFFEEWSGKA